MCKKHTKKCNKGLILALLAIIAGVTVALVIWLKSKDDEYIEEYFEYFDDDLDEEEVDADELYGEDEISADEVEYVELKTFEENDDEVEDVTPAK